MKSGILFLSIVIISGCAQMSEGISALDKYLESLPKIERTPEIELTNDSLTEICEEANKNTIRANDEYSRKNIRLEAEIRDNFSNTFNRTLILLKAGSTSIFVKRKGVNVRKLSNKQIVNVTGTISYVSHDYLGCSITLSNANISAKY